MKVAIGSDLHLEFSDITLPNTDNAKVLILAGDIAVAKALHDYPNIINTDTDKLGKNQLLSMRFHNFFNQVSSEYKHIIYVPGNHEFYHGQHPEGIDWLKQTLSQYSNIQVLNNDSVTIDDILFVCGTLWTNMNKNDPLTMYYLSNGINDFRVIRDKNYHKFTPQHAYIEHNNTLRYFENILTQNKDKQTVIVSHHAPHPLSVHPRYKHDVDMNSGYYSDLTDFILDHTQISNWFHGHVHDSFDYVVGNTRVVCNPRGYAGRDENAQHYQLKFLDI